jgi:hypothetical protein
LDTSQHPFYGGIDLHGDGMDGCVLHAAGEVCRHNHIRTTSKACLQVLPPCRAAVVGGVECLFTWDLAR